MAFTTVAATSLTRAATLSATVHIFHLSTFMLFFAADSSLIRKGRSPVALSTRLKHLSSGPATLVEAIVAARHD
jgi:hypothetical protein